MSMQAKPYLFFDGRCDEALAFYRTALGAKVGALMRYKDNPEPSDADGCPSGGQGSGPTPEMIMHSEFTIGETHLMASDGMGGGTPKFEGISLSLDPGTAEEAGRLFAALADGGQVRLPLAKTFFSPAFGMVADRFGVVWILVVPQ